MQRLLAVMCLLLFLCVERVFAAQRSGDLAQPNSADSKSDIEQILRQQVEAWNRHNLEIFMQGYWHSPQLTFFAGGKVSRGWDAALERYRKEYQSEGQRWADWNSQISTWKCSGRMLPLYAALTT